MGSGSLPDSTRPGRQSVPVELRGAAGCHVVLPHAARDVAADHALDGERLSPAHQHAPPVQQGGHVLRRIAAGLQDRIQNVVDLGADEMVRDDVLQVVQPEQRHLRQHLALAGDGCREDHIEGRQPVGGNDQQLVPEIIDVTHLAAVRQPEPSDVRLENGVRPNGQLKPVLLRRGVGPGRPEGIVP
jgi:hypothetical protein